MKKHTHIFCVFSHIFTHLFHIPLITHKNNNCISTHIFLVSGGFLDTQKQSYYSSS